MTGVTNYTTFKGQEGIAPVGVAIDHMGKLIQWDTAPRLSLAKQGNYARHFRRLFICDIGYAVGTKPGIFFNE